MNNASDQHVILDRAMAGWLEHIEWIGPPFEVSMEDNFLIEPGSIGSIVQVGRQARGVFGLTDETVSDGEILVFFERALLTKIPADSQSWRPLLLPSREALEGHVRNALTRLVTEDAALLRSDLNERTLTGRLALYLQAELSDWHVDCEYNRATNPVTGKAEAKRLAMWLAAMEKFSLDHGIEFHNIFPDIIVHRRESCCNLLVIEVKKAGGQEWSRKRNLDIEKLLRIRTQLGYKQAAFIAVNAANEPSIDEVLWLPDSNERPGGPLCYAMYKQGDFQFASAGDSPSNYGPAI